MIRRTGFWVGLGISFIALFCMLCIPVGNAQEVQPADAVGEEEVKPVEIPENVEVFEVTTSSTINRRVPFYLRFPAGFDPRDQNKIHRILFLCPVYNGDGLDMVRKTGGLIALADERGWCVLSPTFKQEGSDVRDRRRSYYYPETWSGRAVLSALQQIERKYRNIWTDDLLMQGLSGGAQFVHRFAIWAPDRVSGVAVNSSSWFDAPNDRSNAVAWLLTVGEADQSFSESLQFFDQLLEVGALPVFRSHIGMVHEGDARVSRLTLEFLRAVDDHTRESVGRRRSAMERTRLTPMFAAESMPFVGDINDWSYAANTEENLEEIAEDARIFFPSEPVAQAWSD